MTGPKTSTFHENANKHAHRANPLQRGILDFVCARGNDDTVTVPLQANEVPKRYTVYGSLLLLGPTFAHQPTDWAAWYALLTAEERLQLMQCVLNRFPRGVSHIAINAPIALTTSTNPHENSGDEKTDNSMRSPVGLLPLYGDFGPAILQTSQVSQPQQHDIDSAYWTETVQVRSVVQVWAPRWTMFSRGNISEKTRVLQDGREPPPFPGLSMQELGQELGSIDVVDFYIGIGYFAFCYLTRGVKRVWGWEINGWSVEGLRRGSLRNGWGVMVVHVSAEGNINLPGGVDDIVTEIEQHDRSNNAIRCVVFQGDNIWASRIMKEIEEAFTRNGKENAINVRHCNLGLLPSSRGSWEGAMQILRTDAAGWLHVHENTEATTTAIEAMKKQILSDLSEIARTHTSRAVNVSCDYIEQVKTYAPGVMHCVFDIKVLASE